MADLNSRITLIDKVSDKLKSITSKASQMSNAMEKANEKMNKPSRIAENLDHSNRAIDKNLIKLSDYSKEYQDILRKANDVKMGKTKLSSPEIKGGDKSIIKMDQVVRAKQKLDNIISKPSKINMSTDGLDKQVKKLNDYSNKYKNTLEKISKAEVGQPKISSPRLEGIEETKAKMDQVVKAKQKLDNVISKPSKINMSTDGMEEVRSQMDNLINKSEELNSTMDKPNQMADNMEKATNAVEQTTRTLSAQEQKLEIVGQQYARQARVVEQLRAKHQEASESFGRTSEQAEKLKDKLLQAEMKQLKLEEATNRAGKALEQEQAALNQTGDALDKAGQKAEKASEKVGKFAEAFAKLYIAKRILRLVGRAFDATVGKAAQMSRQLAIVQGAFGNQEVGAAYFEKMRKYARYTNTDMEELTNTTKNFMQLTRNTKNLEGLTKMAGRLATRTGSISSAENIMQEAMRGQTSRLQRALHLTDSQVEPLKQAIKRGSMGGVVEAFDEVLQAGGLDEKLEEAFYNNPAAKMERLKGVWQDKMAEMGQGALQAIDPLMDKMTEFLESDFMNKLLSRMSGIMTIVSEAIAWLLEKLMLTFEFIGELADALGQAIGQVLDAIGIDVLGLVGVVVGSVAGVVAAVFNGVALMWNIIASFIEFAVNVWKYPELAAKMAWYNIQVSLLGFVQAGSSLLQGFLNKAVEVANSIQEAFVTAFNWIVSQAQKVKFDIPDWIPGIGGKTFQLMGNVEKKTYTPYKAPDIEGWANSKQAALKAPTLPDDYVTIPKMEYKDIGGAYQGGKDWVASLPDKFNNSVKSMDDRLAAIGDIEDGWNNAIGDGIPQALKDGNKDRKKGNKKKDKIKKAIDKTNEDLKWMRDIAEREVINRFTTAAVAPEIHIAFGDVKETADVDGIVEHLQDILQEGIDSAAEGVYV